MIVLVGNCSAQPFLRIVPIAGIEKILAFEVHRIHVFIVGDGKDIDCRRQRAYANTDRREHQSGRRGNVPMVAIDRINLDSRGACDPLRPNVPRGLDATALDAQPVDVLVRGAQPGGMSIAVEGSAPENNRLESPVVLSVPPKPTSIRSGGEPAKFACWRSVKSL